MSQRNQCIHPGSCRYLYCCVWKICVSCHNYLLHNYLLHNFHLLSSTQSVSLFPDPPSPTLLPHSLSPPLILFSLSFFFLPPPSPRSPLFFLPPPSPHSHLFFLPFLLHPLPSILTPFLKSNPLYRIDWYFLYCTRIGRRYQKSLDIVHREAEKVIAHAFTFIFVIKVIC